MLRKDIMSTDQPTQDLVRYMIVLKVDESKIPVNLTHRQYRQQILDKATEYFSANYSQVNLVNKVNILPALVANDKYDDFEKIWSVKLVEHNFKIKMQGTPTIPKDLENIVKYLSIDNGMRVA